VEKVLPKIYIKKGTAKFKRLPGNQKKFVLAARISHDSGIKIKWKLKRLRTFRSGFAQIESFRTVHSPIQQVLMRGKSSTFYRILCHTPAGSRRRRRSIPSFVNNLSFSTKVIAKDALLMTGVSKRMRIECAQKY
jgi:hypothetical protein